jgi:hypothetical protein
VSEIQNIPSTRCERMSDRCDDAGMLPALRAALICEQLLTERDGVMSAIRIFSRLELPPGATLEATLLVMLANIEPVATPEHHLIVRLETSDGEVLGRQQFPVAVPAEAGASFSVVMPFRFHAPPLPTTFWMCIAFDGDDRVLTRLPLELGQRAAATVME